MRTAQPPRSADARVIGLGKQQLSLSRLRTIAREGPPLELDPACLPALRAGLASVERIVQLSQNSDQPLLMNNSLLLG